MIQCKIKAFCGAVILLNALGFAKKQTLESESRTSGFPWFHTREFNGARENLIQALLGVAHLNSKF